MSKATVAENVIKWLARHADDVAASAADLEKFGPQAARVRALLDFIPTMSDDAVRTSGVAERAAESGAAYDASRSAASDAAWNATHGAAYGAAYGAASDAAYRAAGGAKGNAGRTAAWTAARDAARDAAYGAAMGDVAGDLISPEHYRALTNPLAAGRAVDLLRARPRNQGTPFLDVVRNMGERGALTGPRDVVVASRLANKYDADIIETALALMSDGMPAEEAMRTARLL
mgnify:CR=1 FL=1